MLFLDEHSQKIFCSEECIEDFHLPIVKHFEKEEVLLREKYQLLDEATPVKLTQQIVDDVLLRPDEVYKFSNDLDEYFYHVLKKVTPATTAIVIATMFKNEPSFVFGSVLTQSHNLADEYRQGEKVNLANWNKRPAPKQTELQEEDEEMPDEEDMAFMQLLESKKSKILALMLVKRKDQDIAIEAFGEYDSCFQETLDHPDEVFEFKDNEGDVFFHYIKNYGQFFYLVLCLKRKQDSAEQETMVYPVLGMPTNDLSLMSEFCVGKRISGPLKN